MAAAGSTGDYTISVYEDDGHWDTDADLVVSIMAPVSVIDECFQCSGEIGLFVKSTATGPDSGCQEYRSVHGASLRDSSVFITRDRPNMNSHPSIQQNSTSSVTDDREVLVLIKPAFDHMRQSISQMSVHYKLLSHRLKSMARKLNAIELSLSAPSTIELNIGGAFQKTDILPFPLAVTNARRKTARNRLWFDYEAPVVPFDVVSTLSSFLFGSYCSHMPPSLPALYYVQLDLLPSLRKSKDESQIVWLLGRLHALDFFSPREALVLVAYSISSQQLQGETTLGALGLRMNISALILAKVLAMRACKPVSYILWRTKTTDVCVLIFNSVRMDAANKTVLVDAAFIDASLVHHFDFLGPTGLKEIELDEVEAALFVQLLPACAERCRQWQHRHECEYRTHGQAPLSTVPGQDIMCTCGRGIFPDGYFAEFRDVRDFAGSSATRIALPLIYPSPITPGSDLDPLERGTAPNDKMTFQDLEIHQHARRKVQSLRTSEDDRFKRTIAYIQQLRLSRMGQAGSDNEDALVRDARSANEQLAILANDVANETQELDSAAARISDKALQLDRMLKQAIDKSHNLKSAIDNRKETDEGFETMKDTAPSMVDALTSRMDSVLEDSIKRPSQQAPFTSLSDAIAVVRESDIDIDSVAAQFVEFRRYLLFLNLSGEQKAPAAVSHDDTSSHRIEDDKATVAESLDNPKVELTDDKSRTADLEAIEAVEKLLGEGICNACGEEGFALRCEKCRKMTYCSRECQVKHWKKEHKRKCSKK
ncbi:hypothetical protein FB567DRAFT_239785 [Paraphoma chrysanthemicola]|uniref:MYND-type domain-containing protein n=1 Tax=Paraphoma chrysanthemicola TaxID=798071 RepID=A0A8K0RDZ6_9PLEO|nr:hypothetical protein FB567DRAFT_239785 [Paraphoma chrysanthemicola]